MLAEGAGGSVRRISIGVALLGATAIVVVLQAGQSGVRSTPPEPVPITIDYPAEGALFPPDISAPTVLWRDSSKQAVIWRIEVKFDGGAPGIQVRSAGERMQAGELDPLCVKAGAETPRLTAQQAATHVWKPDASTWAAVKKGSLERAAVLIITGYRDETFRQAVSRGQVTIRTSRDPVGAPVFYRDVPLLSAPKGEKGLISPLPADALPLIAWRLRDIGEPGSSIIMQGLPTCANCHSFSRDGRTLGLDMDGPANDKGLYGLVPVRQQTSIRNDDLIRWRSFSEEPASKRFGFMSQVSPDGQYVITSIEAPGMRERYLEKRLYSALFPNYGFGQVFFPTRGILAWYTRATGKLQPLPGADDPRYVQACAFWSPDGKYLVYSKAEARDPYPEGGKPAKYANDPNETRIQYDLYRIPFNSGRGGTPEPIAGASRNGMSNSFPKVSPDGKWIVFVQCRNGLLMRPDSQLYIVPFQGGAARRLRSNTSRMNSWHSFSPNGRWLVFSSKERSLYTQMYLTHIDANGDDSPAILIENSTAANRAVNIPEFVDIPPDGLQKIEAPATEFYRLYNVATALSQKNEHAEAIRVWKKAIELEPGDAKAHYHLAVSLQRQGKLEEAAAQYRKSLEIRSDNSAAYDNLGVILQQMGKPQDAADQFGRSRAAAVVEWKNTAEFYPEDPKVRFNLALALEREGQLEQAATQYQKTVEMDPQNSAAYINLGVALARTGKLDQAIECFTKSLQLAPDNAFAHGNLGAVLIQRSRLDEAIRHCRRALEIDPRYADAHSSLATALALTGRLDEGISHLQTAVAAVPDSLEFRYNLGRLLAARRSFEQAIPQFEEAAMLSGRRDLRTLELLAAMYSEVGRFSEAAKTARRALEIATEQNDAKLADLLRARIGLYEASIPATQRR
jgi:tetratricopeptide (TPR) repeat protein